jgi:hypothetical protein
MQTPNFSKAGLLAITISILVIVSWEIHLRRMGVPIAYDDNSAMWANKRAMVYQPSDEATVFIGDSRIKYDIDIPTWEASTGQHAVQLANVGSRPQPVLEDLANDKNFKGNLIIDVTEGLFFSDFGFYDWSTRNKIAYYRDQTPTQRFSFQVNHVLESQFVFLDQGYFSINAMLDNMRPPPRPGVFPGLFFPWEFEPSSFARQSFMTPSFVVDTSLQNQVKGVWMAFGKAPHPPPISGKPLDDFLNNIKSLVDKIRSRGGQVVFIRPPSSGAVLQGEMQGFPRAQYWDRLLTVTGCKGVFFTDYPATAHFECPEWSHLSPDQAVIYTRSLIKALEDEKGWSFKKKPAAL